MPINLEKQFTFAMASALTKVGKIAQGEVLSTLRSTFTIRNTWLNPGNAMGIKLLPASKDDLSVAIATKADWLNLHEQEGGGIKVSIGNSKYIAIPTKYVRRTKKDIIQRSQRPRNLDNTFIKTGKTGRLIIYQRQGKGKSKRIVPLYILVPEAHIPHHSTVVEPTLKVFARDFSNVFFDQLKNAIATAK